MTFEFKLSSLSQGRPRLFLNLKQLFEGTNIAKKFLELEKG